MQGFVVLANLCSVARDFMVSLEVCSIKQWIYGVLGNFVLLVEEVFCFVCKFLVDSVKTGEKRMKD